MAKRAIDDGPAVVSSAQRTIAASTTSSAARSSATVHACAQSRAVSTDHQA
jgi:hypothetical protein